MLHGISIWSRMPFSTHGNVLMGIVDCILDKTALKLFWSLPMSSAKCWVTPGGQRCHIQTSVHIY